MDYNMATETTYLSWFEKHKPRSLRDIIGHEESIHTLEQWIKRFEETKITPISKTKGKKNLEETVSVFSAPIVYIYGPCGIGKTSMASLVLQLGGFHIFEMNAGDVRSKKRVQELMEKLLSNHSIDMIRKDGKKWIIGIIMDDIDGMSCGDKGGLHELFATIHFHLKKTNTHVPVICVSNKAYDKRLPNNLILEVELSLPKKENIVAHLASIAEKEKLCIQESVLSDIVDFCGFNIRKCIILLEEMFWSGSQTTDRFLKNAKDWNLFEITSSLYSKPLEFPQMHDIYNFDRNLVPMMIHENILKQLNSRQLNVRQKRLHHYRLMFQLTLGDIVNRHLHCKDNAEHLWFLSALVHCYSLNRSFCSMLNKKGNIDDNKIVFTNSLSKSATQSNTQMILYSTSLCLSLDTHYFYILIPFICEEVLERANREVIKKLDLNEFEKIFQIYQKWTNKKITPKEKRNVKLLFPE